MFYPDAVSRMKDGMYIINFEDVEVESLDMIQEARKRQEDCSLSHNTSVFEVSSSEGGFLTLTSNQFCKKPFLRHQCQGYDQYLFISANEKRSTNCWI